MVEIGRDLWRSSCPVPPAQAGLCEAGCPEPCLGGFWISPESNTPQPLWAACVSAPSQSKSVSWCSEGTPLVSVCAHCLWYCHWAPLRRPWLRRLCNLPQVSAHVDKILSEPCLLPGEQSQLPQPFLIAEMCQSLHHLCGFSLDFLQYVHVSLELGSPHLDTGLQMWLHQCW